MLGAGGWNHVKRREATISAHPAKTEAELGKGGRRKAEGCGLRVAGCGLRVVGCGLWVAGCGLRVVGCGLWENGPRVFRSPAGTVENSPGLLVLGTCLPEGLVPPGTAGTWPCRQVSPGWTTSAVPGGTLPEVAILPRTEVLGCFLPSLRDYGRHAVRSPATHNPQPATRNPQPATRNPQPATRNPQPATRNPQPATRNPQPTTHNPQPTTRILPPSAFRLPHTRRRKSP